MDGETSEIELWKAAATAFKVAAESQAAATDAWEEVAIAEMAKAEESALPKVLQSFLETVISTASICSEEASTTLRNALVAWHHAQGTDLIPPGPKTDEMDRPISQVNIREEMKRFPQED